MLGVRRDLRLANSAILVSTIGYIAFSLALGFYGLLFTNLDKEGIWRVLAAMATIGLFSTRGLIILPIWSVLTTFLSVLLLVIDTRRMKRRVGREEFMALVKSIVLSIILISSIFFFVGIFLVVGWLALHFY